MAPRYNSDEINFVSNLFNNIIWGNMLTVLITVC